MLAELFHLIMNIKISNMKLNIELGRLKISLSLMFERY
jgi:hypothetical protein